MYNIIKIFVCFECILDTNEYVLQASESGTQCLLFVVTCTLFLLLLSKFENKDESMNQNRVL